MLNSISQSSSMPYQSVASTTSGTSGTHAHAWIYLIVGFLELGRDVDLVNRTLRKVARKTKTATEARRI